jgi:hypothetical protein
MIYIPNGCYTINDFNFQGVTLEGQAHNRANNNGAGSVTLKGSIAGADVIKVPDPTTVATGHWNRNWAMRHLTIQPLPGTTETHPHRWPGRWIDDVGTTNGSTIITSGNAVWGCGDVGQAINIGGVGASVTTTTLASAITTTTQNTITLSTGYVVGTWPAVFTYFQIDSEIVMALVSGITGGTTTFTVYRGQANTTAATHLNGATVTVMGNLVTTIASVVPCWSTNPTVNVAAAASVSLSKAHTYISIHNLDTVTTIGGCGIAFDNLDGNSANNITGGLVTASLYSIMDDVSVTPQAASNNTCGMFTQGQPFWYGIHVTNFNTNITIFGIVQGSPEINSFSSSAGDYEVWEDMKINATYPWIMYNGAKGIARQWEVSSQYGPAWLQYGNAAFDDNDTWTIDHVIENTGTNGIGKRINGKSFNISNSTFSNGASSNSYIDCWQCVFHGAANNEMVSGTGVAYLSGANNFDRNGVYNGGGIVDVGAGNDINAPIAPAVFSFYGRYTKAPSPCYKRVRWYGGLGTDSLFDGQGDSFYNRDDLVLCPQDFEVNGILPNFPTPNTYAASFQSDPTSVSGAYWVFTNGQLIQQFNLWNGNLNQPVANAQAKLLITNLPVPTVATIPAGKVTVKYDYYCPSGTNSGQFKVGVIALSSTALKLVSVTAGGSGYQVGDLITVSGGTGGVLQVTGVSTGAVTSILIVTGGSGYTVASGVATTGGSGTGFTANVTGLAGASFQTVTTDTFSSCSTSWQTRSVTADLTPYGGSFNVGFQDGSTTVRIGLISIVPWPTSLSVNGPVNSLTLNSSASQTVVSCATSGTATFSQPLAGLSDKKVVIHLAACNGAAAYTFPTAYANTPGIFASSTVATTLVTSLSTTAATVTGTTSTGTIVLEDY